MSRILSMNEHYIKNINEEELYKHLLEYCEIYKKKITAEKEKKIRASLTFLKNKAKTLEDIFNNAKYIILNVVKFNEEDLKLIDNNAKKIISEFNDKVLLIDILNKESIELIINDLIKKYNTNFKSVGQPLRIALTGSKFGPGLYDIIISLGKEETLARLKKII